MRTLFLSLWLATNIIWGPAARAEQPLRQLSLTAAQQAVLGIQYSTASVAETASLLVNASVTVPPGKQMSIAAPYAGYISQLFVGIGDTVKAGDPLAVFVSPEIGETRLRMVEAETEATLAEDAVGRDQLLFKEGIIAEVRLKATMARAERAQAALRSKKAEGRSSFLSFDDSTIPKDLAASSGIFRAPMTGQIQEVPALIGQRLDHGSPLFRIAETGALLLEITTAAPKSKYIRPGDQVLIPSRNATATVLGVSAAVDTSQFARARARVDQRGQLRLGESVTGLIQISPVEKNRRPLLKVPSRAITSLRGATAVFAQDPKGLTVHSVSVVFDDDETAFIRSDLEPGAKVAISGVAALKALAFKD